MTKDDFAHHMRGFIKACGDNYIASNLEDALERFVVGRPSRLQEHRTAQARTLRDRADEIEQPPRVKT